MYTPETEKDYWFVVNGDEDILVEVVSFNDAVHTLEDYGFDDWEFIGVLTVEEGEAMGFDTY